MQNSPVSYTLSCPGCSEVVSARERGAYTNYLGVKHAKVCCPRCGTCWNEDRSDLYPVEENPHG